MPRADSEKASPRGLSWSLAVATYNRHDALRRCVRLALAQTRPPREVVIVDSSDDWRDGASSIEPLCRACGVRCVYLPGAAKSSAVQRNQALEAVTGDVVFLIDDDSELYPDAAEEALEVYEADAGGVLAGVQLMPASGPPPREGSARDDDGTAVALKRHGNADLLKQSPVGRLLLRELFLMQSEKHFIPYTGTYPDLPIPESVAALPVYRARLQIGFAMTFRRPVIREVGFDPDLRAYCPSEDLDASYRASLRGPMVVARRARVYHEPAAAGRVGRGTAVALSKLNVALFVRKHATDLEARTAELRRLVRRSLVAEALKDAGSRRFGFPQLRALRGLWPDMERILEAPLGAAVEHHRTLQARLLGIAPVSGGPPRPSPDRVARHA